jgi:hypothetical protein
MRILVILAALAATALPAFAFDKEQACLNTATVAGAAAEARDAGVPQERTLAVVMQHTSNNPADRAWAEREVRWVYVNAAIEPALVKQLRFHSCASRLARSS